ncbi:uncharacterized protein LOC141718821 [Apium graveolens]|uniref:uncharacterized protein LOC141703107 n=1 Tax=Apium graveolens TaxID=4045 RepID=UPI003D7920BB
MDSWFWKWEKLGHYSVKSAYAAIQETKQNSCWNDNFPWKRVWNLKVPLKCWCLLGISPVEDDQSSFSNWLSVVIQKCTNRKLQEVVMVCWSMWHNRNEIVWNQRGGEGSEVCRSAKALLNQWQNAQDKSFDNFLGFMNQEDGKERWEQPHEGTVKINVDAAIFENFNTYCWSMAARNHKGELVSANTKCRVGRIAPEIAEALGIKEALSWIKNHSMLPAIVETYCLSVLQAIRCSSVQLSYLGRVIDECKVLVSELKNRLVTLNFVKRSANKVAHFLARHNSSVADRIWSGECVYPELQTVLNNDLSF